MNKKDNIECKVLTNKAGVLQFRRSARRYGTRGAYSVGIHRLVENKNTATTSRMPSGMRPALHKRGCIPTECLILGGDAIFYRAKFPTGKKRTMNVKDNIECTVLTNKAGALQLRHSESGCGEQAAYSVGIHRSVENRNTAPPRMPSGMRPALHKRGCIPTECFGLWDDTIFYRAKFPTGKKRTMNVKENIECKVLINMAGALRLRRRKQSFRRAGGIIFNIKNMKRALFCFSIGFALLIAQNTFGQSGGNEPLRIYSPQVYALARYGDIPVDYSTGVPAIDIPLMSIADRDLSVDVSLSYHATGIKVDEEATWVGLGWVLNAGGIITSQVRGVRDDYINGKFITRPVIPDFDETKPFSQWYTNDVRASLDEISTQHEGGSFDGEPDIFYYNFCGKVGKFILDQNGKACFSKYEDFKVEFAGDFIITDNLGVKYEFSPYTEYQFGYDKSIVWYLKKITSPAGGEISFEYQAIGHNQYRRAETTCWIEVPQAFINQKTSEYKIDYAQYHAGFIANSSGSYQVLKKITAKSGHYIQFNLSAIKRKDVDGYNGATLDEILLYNNKNELQKREKLGYGYFQASANHIYMSPDPQQFPVSSDYFLNYRLRLESVKELSATGTAGATYQFEYYGSSSNAPDYYNLPYRLSASQDHWGYYNYSYNTTIFPNNPANRTIAPDNCLVWGNQADQADYILFGACQLPPIYGEPLTLASNLVTGGANREPDPEAVKAGTLNKIIYPTGGYTQFDFEPNKIDNSGTQGSGIRIKQIESSDGNGNKVIKEYAYEPFWGQTTEYYSNPNTSPYHTLYYNRITEGNANSLLAYMGVPSDMAYKTPVCVIKIDGSSQIKLGIGMDPVYSKVTETIKGGGRTEYQYSNVDNILEGTNSISDPITVNGKNIYDALV